MAKAINFKEENFILKGKGCEDLPVLAASDKRLVSCWELSDEELEEVKKTKKIWLIVHGMHPPVSITGTEPFVKEEKKENE